MKVMTDGCGETFILFIALPYPKNCSHWWQLSVNWTSGPRKNVVVLFWKKEQNFYQMLASCLMFFCDNTAQQRCLERENKL